MSAMHLRRMRLGRPSRPGSFVETPSLRVRHLVSRRVGSRQAHPLTCATAIFKRICELLAPVNIDAKHGSRARGEKNASRRIELREFGGGDERDPNIIQSALSRTVKRDGVTVGLFILRLEYETQVARGGQFRRHVPSLVQNLCKRRRCPRRIRADCRRRGLQRSSTEEM